MSAEPNSAKAVFLAALATANEPDRKALLDERCAGDAELRGRVEALLRAHVEADDLLDTPVVGAPSPDLATPVAAVEVLPMPAEALVLERLGPPTEPGSRGRLDHYEVLDVVGRGGMGVVLKARDAKLQRIVAVKVLHPALADRPDARLRFGREARAAAAIRDEHVVDIHAVEDAGPVPYLVMEFISGMTLDDRVKQAPTFDLAAILRIGMQAARGLAAAHAQGLIHRDVKPANILLENGVQRVKLTDFGLARAVDDVDVTQSGVIAGTPLYMSPEQARAETLDARSDLFSLGSVLYTLCAGSPAFLADSTLAVIHRVCEVDPRPVSAINPNVPEWLTRIIARLMAKDPAERFGSASELANELGRWLAHVQQGETAPHLVPLPGERARSTRRRIGVIAGAVALATLGTLLALPRGPGSSPNELPLKAAPVVARSTAPRATVVVRPQHSPFDDRKPGDVGANLLALAGGGEFAAGRQELVAVLAESRFRMPKSSLTSWPASDREGTWIAIPSDNDVALFDARTGDLCRTFTGHSVRVYCAAVSPDGAYVAAGAWGGDLAVRVWDRTTGTQVHALMGHARMVNRLAFSPDGTRLASAGADGKLIIWDPVRGEKHTEAAGGPGFLYDVAYSHDGRWLASSSGDGHVWVWDASTGEVVQRLAGLPMTGSAQHGVAFSGDDALLAAGGEQITKVWRTADWRLVRTLQTPGIWLAFAGDGNVLLTASTVAAPGQPNTVARWNSATDEQLAPLTLRSQGKWATYFLTPDRKTLYAMRAHPAERHLHAYDADTGIEKRVPRGHNGAVWTVAISRDGNTLVSGSEDGAIWCWDLAQWRVDEALPPARLLGKHGAHVWGLAFSPDGKRVASGSRDKTLAIWDVESGAQLQSLPGHATFASAVEFDAKGEVLAAGRSDGSVRFFDVETGTEGKLLPAHTGHVIGIAYSRDGRYLATAGYKDLAVHVFDAQSRERVATFHPKTSLLGSLAFGPDNRTIAAGAVDGVVFLWDLETRAETILRGHSGNVESVAFHPGGRLLTTAAADGSVRLWNVESGEQVQAFGPGPFGRMARRAIFTPEGRYLVTANFGETVTVLRVPE